MFFLVITSFLEEDKGRFSALQVEGGATGFEGEAFKVLDGNAAGSDELALEDEGRRITVLTTTRVE